MNKAKTLLLITFVLLLASCKEQSPYFVNDVNITIRENLVSRTFANMEFEPDREAFYYVGILEIDSTTDIPSDSDYHFMYMTLDNAYIEYVEWRHNLLEQKVPYIASFTDHMLLYGKCQTYFIGLDFDKEYIVYAFAVDPQLQVPVGKLFKKSISTKQGDATKNMHFDLTVDGYWDFVYPVDSSRSIISNIPYSVLIASQNQILDFYNGDTLSGSPFMYFIYKFTADNFLKDEIKYYDGVSAREHKNNSDPTVINFVEGETYYVGISSLDGYASDHGVTVYKLKWEGDSTHIEYQFEKDDIGFNW